MDYIKQDLSQCTYLTSPIPYLLSITIFVKKTLYKYLIRPLLFLLPAEKAHHFTFSLLSFLSFIPGVPWLLDQFFVYDHPNLKRELLGLTFDHPVGLAAGFDKDAKLVNQWGHFGFSFVEIGTVTPEPQTGNPQPRLFRLPEDQGLINRMGFNNQGLNRIKERLSKKKTKIIIGGNIGKNKQTPNEEAYKDYIKGFEALYDVVDYFVINVSSPNTPNLRELQDKEPLRHILNEVQHLNKAKPTPKPILLKIAPDLNNDQLDDIVDLVAETKIDGVIATNTTVARTGLTTSPDKLENIGSGGLSGMPLRSRATEVIAYLHKKSHGSFTIVGVGGIHRPEDAIEKLKAGASLVQIYTGFVYSGPALIKKINRQVIKEGL